MSAARSADQPHPGDARSSSQFTRLSQAAARWSSPSPVLFAALGILAVWLLAGPWLAYSASWQLVASTGFTIITFLIVQTSQNRAMTAIQIKLDELISAVHGARDELFDLEDLDEEELERLQAKFSRRARRKCSDSPPGEEESHG
ncbi:low affinity iron permease family protein [Bosea sp. Tri-44]|uniref:low affinity iron permease family protein n=1 Tax=Bosea sp. Tri-44 TaxID=1972137 RepID=UPI0013E90FAB|nr:low affinity iron permease family protein [Bosea sp. Tri-44]